MFEIIKKYYEMGIYHEEDLLIFKNANFLTEKEYESLLKDGNK